MNNIQHTLTMVLRRAAERLYGAGLPGEVAAQMAHLAEQVHHPCVVAVVGRVKAGKSTFINALLGQDLAKVGTTETTATINYFRYGQANPDRPVRCYWRGAQVTEEDRAFLDSLQGNDVETLRRAEGIDHLEYHLLNRYLEHITLVDTPGTQAVVGEHQNTLAEFMHLSGQLRERHDQETQQLASQADAVLYLIGETARTADRDFLEEFRQVTQGRSRSFNAVGVMAKIDLNPEVMDRRDELAAKIASQLQDSLNTVIPVSAGIRRALDRLLEYEQQGLVRLMEALRRIPPDKVKKLLADARLYLRSDPNVPVTPAERQTLKGEMPWMVFKTIAEVAAYPNLDVAAVVERLDRIAGFDRLKAVLERHFFKRSHLLRGYRTVNDARRVLSTIKFKHLLEFRKDKARLERFLTFIRQAGGDPATAHELEAFIHARFTERAGVEGVVQDLERAFARIFHELEEYNSDFEALQHMEDHANLFSPSQQDELRALLGLYGMEVQKRLPADCVAVAYVEERQQTWGQLSQRGRSPVVRGVAQRAVDRYGLILNELLGNMTASC
jgi:hypothetical protein